MDKLITLDMLTEYDTRVKNDLGKIEISESEPTDVNTKIWINPDEVYTGEGGDGVNIDDSEISYKTTYSSQKIETELDKKMNYITLAEVATSGSYNDLNDKPIIPDISTLAQTSNALPLFVAQRFGYNTIQPFSLRAYQSTSVYIPVPALIAENYLPFNACDILHSYNGTENMGCGGELRSAMTYGVDSTTSQKKVILRIKNYSNNMVTCDYITGLICYVKKDYLRRGDNNAISGMGRDENDTFHTYQEQDTPIIGS